MACTIFCSCQGSEECFNMPKEVAIEFDDDDEALTQRLNALKFFAITKARAVGTYRVGFQGLLKMLIFFCISGIFLQWVICEPNPSKP